MFIAAMLDAFPDLRDGMLLAIRAAGLPDDISCRAIEHRDEVLTGLRFLVEGPPYRPHDRGLALPEERHRHTPFRDIRDRLERSTLAAGVKRRAVHIFSLLAEVEGKVHGMPAEEVSFHELGSWDSIQDMMGAPILIDAMAPSSYSVSAYAQPARTVQ